MKTTTVFLVLLALSLAAPVGLASESSSGDDGSGGDNGRDQGFLCELFKSLMRGSICSGRAIAI